MKRLLVALLCLTGCDQLFGLTHVNGADPLGPDGGVSPDGDANASTDADAVVTVDFTPSNLSVDDLHGGVQAVVLSTATIDTDGGSITGVTLTGIETRIQAQASAPEIQVFRFKSLTIQGAVTVTGSRALALVAATTINVTGAIQFTGQTACTSGTSGDGTSSGGGAGFGTAGGAGAIGYTSTMAGAAGPARGTATLVPLLTGCRGAAGKTTSGSTALGGAGGGAIQLVAGGRIDIAGTVCAPGLGGAIGLDTVGSGGGGSGGAILLEAPTVNVAASGTLAANGGGGGGSSGPFGADGQPGGFSCSASAGGAGGTGDGTAGSGGDGGYATVLPQAGVAGAVGTGTYAGGGGGAVGRIRVNRMDGAALGGAISPAASMGVL